MGGHGWGQIDDADSRAAIHRALDLGVNLFDTADVYGFGHSERLLSDTLGEDRHRVYIATKGGVRWSDDGRTHRDISPKTIVKALEGSLRRLRVDCISLYQIHWPDGVTPIACTMEALVRCREEGKIRWIGCSNFSIAQMAEARQVHPVATLQMPYNLLDRGCEESLLPYCQRQEIAALTYAPLAQGALTGKYRGRADFDATDVRSRTGYFSDEITTLRIAILERLKHAAAEYGRTPAQVAIRWVLDHGGVSGAVTGVTTAQQFEENLGALDWKLSVEARDLIAGAPVGDSRVAIAGRPDGAIGPDDV